MDDRRRKQIPWNAIHYFPGNVGEVSTLKEIVEELI